MQHEVLIYLSEVFFLPVACYNNLESKNQNPKINLKGNYCLISSEDPNVLEMEVHQSLEAQMFSAGMSSDFKGMVILRLSTCVINS